MTSHLTKEKDTEERGANGFNKIPCNCKGPMRIYRVVYGFNRVLTSGPYDIRQQQEGRLRNCVSNYSSFNSTDGLYDMKAVVWLLSRFNAAHMLLRF